MQKLRIFIEDADQNLKYLGLQAMAQVLKIAPKAVLPHRDLIIECLDDRDESIRLRALDLLSGAFRQDAPGLFLSISFLYPWLCLAFAPSALFFSARPAILPNLGICPTQAWPAKRRSWTLCASCCSTWKSATV